MINSPQLLTGHTCMTYLKDTSLHNLPKIMLHTVSLILKKKKDTFWSQKDFKLYVIVKMNNFNAVA